MRCRELAARVPEATRVDERLGRGRLTASVRLQTSNRVLKIARVAEVV